MINNTQGNISKKDSADKLKGTRLSGVEISGDKAKEKSRSRKRLFFVTESNNKCDYTS